MFDDVVNSKERKTDRLIVLKPMEGKTAVSSTGLIDPRVFSGDNKLHAIKDTGRDIWNLKYDKGGLPEPLKVSFTNFSLLMEHVKAYFAKRNIQVVDVID